MNQVLHVFRKDARRLWIENSLSIIALGVVTWCEWLLCTPGHQSRWYNNVVPTVVVVLIWWFMTVRLVHGEALVGDRQFWITRPYVWYKLLASKVLFVVAFIGVPITASQVVLLMAGRAPVLPLVGKLLSDTAFTIVIGIVPVAGLAVLTRKLSQWVIGAIGVVLVIVGLAALDSYIPNSHVPTGSDTWEVLQALAFAFLAAIAIVIQYARRRRLLAWTAMAAAVASVPVIMAATPYRAIIRNTFPIVTPDSVPFHLELQPSEQSRTSTEVNFADKKVPVSLPVEVSGVPQGAFLELNGVMLSIDTPDGQHWDSEWRPGYRNVFEGKKRFALDFELDRAMFEKVQTVPSTIGLSVAFSESQETQSQRVILNSEFELPGVGYCWAERDPDIITCRSTEGAASSTLLTISKSDSTCPHEKTNKTDEGPGILRDLATSFASGPFTPLTLRHFSLTQWDQTYIGGTVCAGTPATFSTPKLMRKAQVRFELGKLPLGEYTPGRVRLRFSQAGTELSVPPRGCVPGTGAADDNLVAAGLPHG